jgi:O-antigen/teichoic acid export membrane protein
MKLGSSTFLKDTATLMSGTVLGQLLPIAFSPVMTRLFTPADYGVLGIYTAFTGILGVMVTSQYNHAIMLPAEDEDSINVFGLCLAISLGIGVLVAAAVVFNNNVHHLVTVYRDSWLYLVPVSVVLAGWYTSLSCWTNRKSKYRRLAISRFGQAVVTIAIQLSFGLLYKGPAGLLLGLVGGQLTVTGLMAIQVWLEDRDAILRSLSAPVVRTMAAKHRSFAYYLLPADFINVFNNQIPTLLLNRFSVLSEVGSYNFSQRILGLPSALIASSITDVFRQKAISDYNATGNCREIFVKTFKVLALLGLVPLVVVLVGAPTLFALVFGAKWRDAGVYAQLLSVMFFLRFVVSPLSYIYYIVGKQKEDLVLHVVMAIGTVIALGVGYYFFGSPKWMIFLFSVSYSLIYLVYLVRSYTFTKGVR